MASIFSSAFENFAIEYSKKRNAAKCDKKTESSEILTLSDSESSEILTLSDSESSEILTLSDSQSSEILTLSDSESSEILKVLRVLRF